MTTRHVAAWDIRMEVECLSSLRFARACREGASNAKKERSENGHRDRTTHRGEIKRSVGLQVREMADKTSIYTPVRLAAK